MARRMTESEPLLRQLADELPAHWLANRALAQIYRLSGRAPEGEKYLRAAFDHGDRDAGLMLAESYLAERRDGAGVLGT